MTTRFSFVSRLFRKLTSSVGNGLGNVGPDVLLLCRLKLARSICGARTTTAEHCEPTSSICVLLASSSLYDESIRRSRRCRLAYNLCFGLSFRFEPVPQRNPSFLLQTLNNTTSSTMDMVSFVCKQKTEIDFVVVLIFGNNCSASKLRFFKIWKCKQNFEKINEFTKHLIAFSKCTSDWNYSLSPCFHDVNWWPRALWWF